MIAFKPWIGKNYEQSAKKILVVGLSHYNGEGGEAEYYDDFTSNVVEGWLSGESTIPFITKISNVFTKADADFDINRIAFYNYIQQFVGDGPRQSPTLEMIANAKTPFRMLLESIKPTHVFLLGNIVWESAPKFDCADLEATLAGKARHIGMYRFGGGACWVCGIPHPSGRNWRTADVSELVRDFLAIPVSVAR